MMVSRVSETVALSGKPLVRRPWRRGIAAAHRWLGLFAAIFWLVQAVTGSLLAFHFEIEDAAISAAHQPTDLAAIERRIDSINAAGGEAKLHWIWVTAGLPDRYLIFFDGPDGVGRKAYIDGAGKVLRDRPADDMTFLQFVRDTHLTLGAGRIGHWLLLVTGLLLATNILAGIAVAWPYRGQWRQALMPRGSARKAAGLYSWHRAIGLWAAIPAFVVALTGALLLLEHELQEVMGVVEYGLPANPPTRDGRRVGFAAAVPAAVAAIPGSRFVGFAPMPPDDASYYIWVRGPGELYRGGYGGSLVVIDSGTGKVRAAFSVVEAEPARAIIAALYPIHTGEAGRTPGRLLVMAVGLWLSVSIVLGLLLWWRKRPRGLGA